ncbi:MAG TPA: CocE/NonD family hydrolase [Caulobacteraceae bacterium]|nr:CocE/NonD family hydrolase [Caulobacteraceae bacterium]
MASVRGVRGAIVTAMAAGQALGGLAIAADKVSSPGHYSGYSPVLYDGYSLTSQYVTMRDGTRIAVDVYRPTLHGAVVDQKLPVVWQNTPYNRRSPSSAAQAMELVKYGYVVAMADMRGNYASFGKAIADAEAASAGNRNEWMPWSKWDAYDVTEWLAAQPWSTGDIGMMGCSAVGMSQWQAASTAPPHLKAIFPQDAPSEYYDWNGLTPRIDPPPPPPGPAGVIPAQDAKAVAVDADKDGSLLAAAKEDHKGNLATGYIPFRDSVSPGLKAAGYGDFRYNLEVNTFEHFADINKSGIPIYETTNFGEDMRVKLGVMVKLHNVKNPIRLVVAPGNHCNWSTDAKPNPSNDFDITAEQVRWYDYWLKGIKNGVLDEPPVYYYTYNDPANDGWKFAWQWPLPTQKTVKYYLAAGAPTAPTAGVNKGGLSAKAPTAPDAKDLYTVDYTVGATDRNEKGMTYTTVPLKADSAETGHPIVHLWVSTTATDGDFLAFLADVGPDGKVTPLPGTEDGKLRASVRALNPAPYDNLGLPYHRAFEADSKPLTPNQPTELVFDMAPISYVFKAGHSIRLLIVCQEIPRHGSARPTPVLTPPPVVTFYRDAAHPSYIAMPVNAPVPATVSLTADRRAVRIGFPRGLDRRYLQDIKPGSVKVGGVVARKVEVHDGVVIADLGGAVASPGKPLVVQGQFGAKYYYGDLAGFTGSAVVPGHP